MASRACSCAGAADRSQRVLRDTGTPLSDLAAAAVVSVATRSHDVGSRDAVIAPVGRRRPDCKGSAEQARLDVVEQLLADPVGVGALEVAERSVDEQHRQPVDG